MPSGSARAGAEIGRDRVKTVAKQQMTLLLSTGDNELLESSELLYLSTGDKRCWRGAPRQLGDLERELMHRRDRWCSVRVSAPPAVVLVGHAAPCMGNYAACVPFLFSLSLVVL